VVAVLSAFTTNARITTRLTFTARDVAANVYMKATQVRSNDGSGDTNVPLANMVNLSAIDQGDTDGTGYTGVVKILPTTTTVDGIEIRPIDQTKSAYELAEEYTQLTLPDGESVTYASYMRYDIKVVNKSSKNLGARISVDFGQGNGETGSDGVTRYNNLELHAQAKNHNNVVSTDIDSGMGIDILAENVTSTNKGVSNRFATFTVWVNVDDVAFDAEQTSLNITIELNAADDENLYEGVYTPPFNTLNVNVDDGVSLASGIITIREQSSDVSLAEYNMITGEPVVEKSADRYYANNVSYTAEQMASTISVPNLGCTAIKYEVEVTVVNATSDYGIRLRVVPQSSNVNYKIVNDSAYDPVANKSSISGITLGDRTATYKIELYSNETNPQIDINVIKITGTTAPAANTSGGGKTIYLTTCTTSTVPTYASNGYLITVLYGKYVSGTNRGCLYNSGITDLVIPDSICSLNYYSFANCTSLRTITFPSEDIKLSDNYENLFLNCNNLTFNTYDNAKYLGNSTNPYMYLIKPTSTSITSCVIHEDTKVIGYDPFRACKSLTSVTFSSSVKYVGNFAFYGCSGLTAVHASSLEDWMDISFPDFYGGSPLNNAHHLYVNGSEVTSVVIPEGTKTVGAYAFGGARNITNISLPSTLKSIGSNAFYGCGITSITLPSGLTTIRGEAFSGCSGLTSIVIPASVIYMEYGVFSGTGLISVTILNPNIDMSTSSFAGCDAGETQENAIIYNGTQAQLNAMFPYPSMGSNDIYKYFSCTDGVIGIELEFED